ncbi:hypothetical protein IAD21_01006 [Abditibacteriota bacterium]|nr:hypothetical protein IAD21_01006 [Abditibacteriota bacterium]
MRFLVLSHGEVVGHSNLPHIDVGMGIVRGLFYPNERYATIQPIIRSHMMADGLLGEHDPTALKQARERIKELELQIQDANSEPLECELVHITDLSQELEENGCEIDVLGFSSAIKQKFWPVEWENWR